MQTVSIPEIGRGWHPAKCNSAKFVGNGFYTFSDGSRSFEAWVSWDVVGGQFRLTDGVFGRRVGEISAEAFDNLTLGRNGPVTLAA